MENHDFRQVNIHKWAGAAITIQAIQVPDGRTHRTQLQSREQILIFHFVSYSQRVDPCKSYVFLIWKSLCAEHTGI